MNNYRKYADVVVLVRNESEEKLRMLIVIWKGSIEAKGLRVNMRKIKVMICQVGSGPVQGSREYPCGVRKQGVGRNSIKSTGHSVKWIHKRLDGFH